MVADYIAGCVAARALEHVRLVMLWLAAKVVTSGAQPTREWVDAYEIVRGRADEAVRSTYDGASMPLPHLTG